MTITPRKRKCPAAGYEADHDDMYDEPTSPDSDGTFSEIDSDEEDALESVASLPRHRRKKRKQYYESDAESGRTSEGRTKAARPKINIPPSRSKRPRRHAPQTISDITDSLDTEDEDYEPSSALTDDSDDYSSGSVTSESGPGTPYEYPTFRDPFEIIESTEWSFDSAEETDVSRWRRSSAPSPVISPLSNPEPSRPIPSNGVNWQRHRSPSSSTESSSDSVSRTSSSPTPKKRRPVPLRKCRPRRSSKPFKLSPIFSTFHETGSLKSPARPFPKFDNSVFESIEVDTPSISYTVPYTPSTGSSTSPISSIPSPSRSAISTTTSTSSPFALPIISQFWRRERSGWEDLGGGFRYAPGPKIPMRPKDIWSQGCVVS